VPSRRGFTMWWSSHQFIKGMLGHCVPFQRTRMYLAAAISAISRGWSLVVSSMRLEMWIVVGSEVMVRRSTHSNPMVWVLYNGSVCCVYDHAVRKSGANRYGQEFLPPWFVAHTGTLLCGYYHQSVGLVVAPGEGPWGTG